MNARQTAKSNMCQVVKQLCDENSAILSEVKAFENAVNRFKNLIAQLLETEQIASQPLGGITADKLADRANLCKLAANLAGYIYAYASVVNNETLRAEVHFSHSKLLLMREDRFVSTSQNIHAVGTTNKSALRDYGVTDEKLVELQTAIDAFKDSMTKPRAAKGQKSTLTANRDEILAQIDDVLTNQMDLLVQNYEDTHPEFVHRYRQARKIVDPATTRTQLKGKVVSKINRAPVKDAKVTIVELMLTANTTSTGEYRFKPVEHGEYTIRTTAIGFQDFEKDEFRIKLGEVNRLDIELT